MMNTAFTPPTIDRATIDAHVEAAKRTRHQVIRGMVASLFGGDRARS